MPPVSETDAILQRLGRPSSSSASSGKEPPDSARAELGKRLAVAWCKQQDKLEGNAIIAAILQKRCNPSVLSAFCRLLEETQPHAVTPLPIFWISDWIVLAEPILCADDNRNYNDMQPLIRLYARHAVSNCTDHSGIFPELFFKLQQAVTRTSLVRQLTHVAFGGNSDVTAMLSPVMACILSQKCPLEERMNCLQGIFRECYKSSSLRKEIVVWLVLGLEMHLLGLQGTTQKQTTMEISFQWMLTVSDLLTRSYSVNLDWGTQLSTIITKILPHYFLCDSCFCLEQVWSNLHKLVIKGKTQVSEECILQLAVFCISTPVKEEVVGILTLLEASASTSTSSKWISQLMLTIACIFQQDEANEGPVKKINLYHSVLQTSGEITDILQHFGSHSGDALNFINYTIDSIQNLDTINTSVLDQNALFLLSCVLLTDTNYNLATSMAIALLKKFPFFGITMLPILLQSIQQATDGTKLQQRVTFICDYIVHDPHCAQEVWNIVGVSFTDKYSPTEVRTMAIRSFPNLVASNRRLYRRVIDSIGSMIEERNTEIRLAIAATIHDLAARDLILDVSDVIGWLQTFLTDESNAVVHLAILALHHLIVNGELDFDVVVKVLSKRICPVGDVNQVLDLHLLVIDALVVLLGDGELIDDVNDKEILAEYAVSAQVQSAVSTLIALALSSRLSCNGGQVSEPIRRIRLGILKSLANYSLPALGLDIEGVQSATKPLEGGSETIPDAARRYNSVKELTLESIAAVDTSTVDNPAILLARKIVLLEEDALGTSVWQKGLKPLSSRKSKSSTSKKQDISSSLPDPDSVREMYDSNPSPATSIAGLLAFDGTERSYLMDYAGDLGNVKLNPVQQLLLIQGWLQAMLRTWSAISSATEIDEIKDIIQEILEWRNVLDDADFAYFALSCLSLHMPQIVSSRSGSEINLSTVVDNIHTTVEQAFKGHEFQSKDIAYLSLACIAVRALDGGFHERFIRCLVELESVAQSGEEAFGALYGLSIIVQHLASSISTGRSDAYFSKKQRETALYKAVGLLIDCTNALSPKEDVRVIFAACVRTGKATTDLAKSLSMLAVSEVESQQNKFDTLMAAFALCGPSLSLINPQLGRALFFFLKGFQAGMVHSFALSSLYESCKSIRSLSEGEIEDFDTETRNLWNQSESFFFMSSMLLLGTGTEPALIQAQMNHLNNVPLVEVEPNMLLGVLPLITTLPTISLGNGTFRAAAQTKNVIDKTSVSTFVERLSFLAVDRGDTSEGSMATIVYGLFASLKLPPIELKATPGLYSGVPRIPALAMNITRIPIPLEGTVLSGLIACLRERSTNQDKQSSILKCLQPLSLPSQFADGLLDPIIMDVTLADTTLKAAAIDLLLSQISGRRRATFDGREFVGLAARTTATDASSLHLLLGSATSILLSSIHLIVSKASAESIAAILNGSWSCCLEEQPQVIIGWLTAIQSILLDSSSRNMSPKVVKDVRRFLVNTVFTGISTLDDNAFSVVETKFVDCLRAIPLEFLDHEEKFFTFKEDDEHLRMSRKVKCSMGLLLSGYFESRERIQSVFLSAIAWFVRLEANENSVSTFRRCGMAIATATVVLDDSVKNQVLMLMLEAMLVQKASSPNMELIGAITGKWTHQPGNVSSLSTTIFSAADRVLRLDDTSITLTAFGFLKTIPADIGAVTSKGGTASILSNRLIRILGTWTKSKGGDRILLTCLQMSLSCLAHSDSSGALQMSYVMMDFLNQVL